MSKWIIDKGHSDVHFKVRYLVISSVVGSFTSFEGTVETDGDNFEGARIWFSADTSSISTNNEKRDADLRHKDFFDTAHFPKLEFSSTSYTHEGNGYILRGKLTIKGVTQQVDLNVTQGGIEKDPEGKVKAGFELEGSVNRDKFGLIWSTLMESGAIILGEDVKIMANIQLIKVG